MSILLSEAVTILDDTFLRAGDSSFYSLERKHRMIRRAGNKFLRETQISRTTTSRNTAASTATIDVTAATGAGSFLPGYLYSAPFITTSGAAQYRPLAVLAFDMVRQYLENSPSTTGVPEMIGWLTPSGGYMYPVPNAVYAVSFPWWQPLTSMTPGQAVDATLNLPEQYADDIIGFGAYGYLVHGLPGHGEGQNLLAMFEQLIEQVRGEQQGVEVYFPDTTSSASYRPVGGI